MVLHHTAWKQEQTMNSTMHTASITDCSKHRECKACSIRLLILNGKWQLQWKIIDTVIMSNFIAFLLQCNPSGINESLYLECVHNSIILMPLLHVGYGWMFLMLLNVAKTKLECSCPTSSAILNFSCFSWWILISFPHSLQLHFQITSF